MNSTIKNWLHKTLQLTDDGHLPSLSLSEFKAYGLKIPSEIDALLLAASTSEDGKIPAKQGLKTIRISPLIFLSNLAKKASELSQANVFADSYASSVCDYITNYTLFKMNELLSDPEFDVIASFNDFQDNNDVSLNFIHNIVQVKSLLSTPPLKLSANDQKERVEAFFNGEQPLSDLVIDENLVMRTSGINSYFVAKLLSNPRLDFENYLQNITKIDANSPYIYRLNTCDYYGASVCLWKACQSLTYEEKLEKAKEYLTLIINNRETTLDNVGGHISTINEKLPEDKRLFFATIPQLFNDDLSDQLGSNAIGHAFSYTTSLGLAPTAAVSFNSEMDTTPFSDEVAKLFAMHTHEAMIYSGKLLHSDEALQEASEIVSSFTQTVRI